MRPQITKEVDCQSVLQAIEEFEQQLEKSSEEELAFLWRVRNTLDERAAYKKRTMIWDECERRYIGFSRKPLQICIPFFAQLDGEK